MMNPLIWAQLKSLLIHLRYGQNGSCVPPLTSKLCAEVCRTGYECSLDPENENLKLEMETTKFPAKIDFNFHWKSSSLQTETSDFRLWTRFSVFVSEQRTISWVESFKPGRHLPQGRS